MDMQVQSASKIQMDYMKLLVTQMQNQNPLEPMTNNDMASQLAQFSQLSQMETMNSSFAKVLKATEMGYANQLIGRKVTFEQVDAFGDVKTVEAIVKDVKNSPDGVKVNLVTEAGEQELALDRIKTINY